MPISAGKKIAANRRICNTHKRLTNYALAYIAAELATHEALAKPYVARRERTGYRVSVYRVLARGQAERASVDDRCTEGREASF